ncbi:bis(5'-nucleosyl)-tetraphosphatase (symmetrical) YqeK [Feifania hominis]|uniref:bis(5'-nucleosyl)-tetraphosphatase (symmetrical) n=1 Tax=Feifania hominis TaxID=2763660 RepID=A0A926DDB6_9FIRM|nr:bis(5'-nucleosyl)-tetraphosphatase (symmetrical) YqeK [Feifania hominis]MBC8535704.1 bis(5'-nucleosyl)-tetraphosphatase (symmetrical) YqeK [Feifania hominis]
MIAQCDGIKLLEQMLSEKRFRHSLSVRDEAVRLARRYGADEQKAEIAGLYHDVTKDMGPAEQLKMCDEFGIMLNAVERSSYKLLHALTGACYTRERLGVDDEEIFGAIYYHTTGRADMTLLEKIIYMADYVEPLRDFDGVEPVRAIVYEDLDRALLLALDNSFFELLGKHAQIHPNTLEARNFLLEKRQKK